MIPRVLVFILFWASSSFGATILNLEEAYKNFLVEAAQVKTQEEFNVALDRMESPYKSIFDEAIYRPTSKDSEIRKKRIRDNYFKEFKSVSEETLILFSQVNEITKKNEEGFRKIFPDLPSDVPVIFLPSYFTFNGRVQSLSGYSKSALLIGVDFVAQREDDIDLLFSHEFFHAYHETYLEKAGQGSNMATPLWKEGFATYVGGIFHPQKTDSELLLDPVLGEYCGVESNIKNDAEEYLEILSSAEEKIYNDWFLMSGSTKPVRRGYCLGLIIIREIAKTYNLNEMKSWGENRFFVEIEKMLNVLKN